MRVGEEERLGDYIVEESYSLKHVFLINFLYVIVSLDLSENLISFEWYRVVLTIYSSVLFYDTLGCFVKNLNII